MPWFRLGSFAIIVVMAGCNPRVTPPKVPLPQAPPTPPTPTEFVVESVDGGFKVAFPAQPVRSANKGADGKPSENYVIQSPQKALVVGFSYPPIPIPSDQLTDKAISAGLHESIESYVRESKGSLVSKEAFFMGNIPGVNFESKIVGTQPGDTADVKGSVLWLEGRLIRMVAIGQPSWLRSKEVSDFFDSFSILPKKK